MILIDIQRSLDTRAQQLTDDPQAIAWDGVSYEPDMNRPYYAVKMSGRDSQQLGIGHASPRFWSGFYQILVCHPQGEGKYPALKRADAVLKLFPRGLLMIEGGRKIQVERSSALPEYVSADWINVPVVIGWFCEEV